MRALTLSFLLSFVLLLIAQDGNSQCSRSKKNHDFWEIRTAVGVVPTFVKDHAQTIMPPLSMEVRYRPSPVFSLGFLAGTSVSAVTQEHFTGNAQRFENRFRMLALRAGVHTQRWEKWETYGGLVLAYQDNRVSSTTTTEKISVDEPLIHYTPHQTGFFYSAFLGTAYQPAPRLKLFGELSYGLSLVTLGAGFSW